MSGKHRSACLVTAIFLAIQAFIWFVIFRHFWFKGSAVALDDVQKVYYSYAKRIAAGALPYRDFPVEYPPVATLFFYLPFRISGANIDSYTFWFEVVMFIVNINCTILIAIYSWQRWQNLRWLAITLTTYTLLLLATGNLVQARFDILVAFFILFSLICFINERHSWAWIFLGVGFMTKIIPILLAPYYLMVYWRRRQSDMLWQGPLAMSVAIICIGAPLLIIASSGLLNSFLIQFSRPVMIESLWAVPLLLAEKLGLLFSINNRYGSVNIVSSFSTILAVLSGPAMLILLEFGYFGFHRFYKTGSPRGNRYQLVRFAIVGITTFILFGKVFSPQFLIWLLPMVPLALGEKKGYLIVFFFMIALALTQFEYPYHIAQLVRLNDFMIWEVSIRDMMLALMLVLLMGQKTGGSEKFEHIPPPASDGGI